MKLNDKFIIHSTEKETVLVPIGGSGFPGMLKGNKTFCEVLELLKQETTKEQIIESLQARYDAPDGKIESDVSKVLEELKSIGALDK